MQRQYAIVFAGNLQKMSICHKLKQNKLTHTHIPKKGVVQERAAVQGFTHTHQSTPAQASKQMGGGFYPFSISIAPHIFQLWQCGWLAHRALGEATFFQ